MSRSLATLPSCVLAFMLGACGGASSGSNGTPGGPGSTAPSITTEPMDATAAVGQTAKFQVVAQGTGPLQYQWNRGGTAIAGATNATYTTAPVTMTDNGAAFNVSVSNSQGSVTSNTVTLTVTAAAATGADVTTFKNDTGRTGQNLAETTLTTANVNSTSFGLLRMLQVDGKVDAQPLYLSQLTVGGALRNVVFVATENDSVYAFDADSGAGLWHVSLLKSGENTSDTHGCGQIEPSIGITSTPVIDRSAGPHGTLYVVAMSLDSSSAYHQRLHALDVTTGAEMPGSPMEITGSFTNAGGTTTFNPGQYAERAALLLANGVVYTSWTSHCDDAPYGGWIIGFNKTSLAQTSALNVAPASGTAVSGGNHYNTYGPAIWMAGDGPGADPAGNVYLLTGNGRFEPTLDASGFPNLGDFGNSFVKIAGGSGTLRVADYFAMSNEVAESGSDGDLGSGGEMLLPDMMDSSNTVRHLVVGAGKDGNLYVVDRDNMGKFDSGANHIWQEIDGVLGGGVVSSPAYFNGRLYYGDAGGTLKAFTITSARLSANPTSQSTATFTYPGTSPAVSANGTSNAIVWAHQNTNPAVLRAYDATNLAHELYDSDQASGSRDQFGAGNKFITPMIAGGKVFVGASNGVAVFGLLGH